MPDQQKHWWEFGRTANDCDTYHILLRLQVAVLIGCVLVIAYSVQFHGTGESLKIAAIGIAIAGSALFLGFLAGFIFCIPRAAKRDVDKILTVSTPGDQSSTSSTPERDSFEDNSNLVEISDWITKILVGVGLVELTKIPHALWGFCAHLAPGLAACGSTACTAMSQTFVLALLLFFFPIGFLIGYIWTRLYYQEELSNLKRKLVQVSKEKARISEENDIQFLINEANIKGSYWRFDDALISINKALDLDPQNGRALFERGRILKRMAEKEDGSFDSDLLEKALADMTEASHLMPKKGPPIYNMACYQNLLNYPPQEVLATLKLAFDKDPTLKEATTGRSNAADDPDFKSLQNDAEFQALTGAKPEQSNTNRI